MRASPRGSINHAFTLIELLIVTAVLSIVIVSITDTLVELAKNRQQLEIVTAIDSSAAQALDRWRSDVALATRVEITPDGTVQLIQFLENGEYRQVHYEFTENSLVRRQLTPPHPEAASETTLAVQLETVAFSPVERGWRCHLGFAWSDGINRWQRSYQALATPLAEVIE